MTGCYEECPAAGVRVAGQQGDLSQRPNSQHTTDPAEGGCPHPVKKKVRDQDLLITVLGI